MSACPAQWQNEPAPPASKPPAAKTKVMLKAGITHSETLPPMSPDHQVGKLVKTAPVLVSGAKAQVLKKFKVPAWLAGTWQREYSTETMRLQLPGNRAVETSGRTQARVTDKFGTYADAKGQVWQTFNPKKAIGNVDRGSAVDYHAVAEYDLTITGPKSCVVEVTAAHVVLNKQTRRIMSAYQDEELNQYTLVTDGVVRTDSSVKVFDTWGKAKLLTKSVSRQSRIMPFTGIPQPQPKQSDAVDNQSRVSAP